MTDKEWDELVREAKNDGTYSKLTRAIRQYTEITHDNILNTTNVIKENFNKDTIKWWYLNV